MSITSTAGCDAWQTAKGEKMLRIGILVFVLAVASYAQSVEATKDLPIIGEISALQGLTKVYIAGATSDERKIVIKAFDSEKKKIPL